jgi:hypothetical protein
MASPLRACSPVRQGPCRAPRCVRYLYVAPQGSARADINSLILQRRLKPSNLRIAGTTGGETGCEMEDPRETLRQYPYVVVRLRCDCCGRSGGYRLASLVEKYGAGFPLELLIERLAYPTCGRNPVNRQKHRLSGPKNCETYLCDLRSDMAEADLPPARDPYSPKLPFARGNEVDPERPYWRPTSARRRETIETIRRTGSTVIPARCLHCKRERFLGTDRWSRTVKLDAIEQRLVCIRRFPRLRRVTHPSYRTGGLACITRR